MKIHLNTGLASANQLHIDLLALDTSISQSITTQNTLGHPDRLEFRDHFRRIA